MRAQNDPAVDRFEDPLPATGLTVEIKRPVPGAAVCVLAGDLDVETLATAAQALDQLAAQHPTVLVVDLALVGFCDSSGLNLLLRTRLAADAAGIDFRLSAPSPTVLRVLELTGTDAVFSLHPSTQDALAAPC
ncbi:metal ABC transporter substrate-binding protein [Streptomyces tateyamensis]|uniref:Anti-sigma factor antagonist n=1 Tax=Streptomyces tateyamensis TaxID=565073 RepID=A0A2V4NYR1_9ACTN|nr:STAS domain-containing protein [Streptomyces tateyamensis]PYC69036.1 metal ABC transporter substrate-binding protein [Streptomyces tateyamensis]